MWINNGISEKQILESGTIPDGFVKGRKPKIKKIDLLIQKVKKEDLINYYIIENHSFIETLDYFNLEFRKDLRQLLTHYGVAKDKKQAAKYTKRTRSHESYVNGGKKSSITQKINWENKSDEYKQEWSNMQKVAHNTESFKNNISAINKEYRANLDPVIESEMNSRRSISCKKAWSNSELIKRQHETARNNRIKRRESGQICRTKAEQKIYDCLIKFYDVQYDLIVDERYPYYIDFYIESLDLFIEYQGHPSHGKYPFIKDDKISINEANRLYGQWRDQYIRYDVEKYNKAIESNINFIRVYPSSSLNDNYKINDYKFKDIIELVYNA